MIFKTKHLVKAFLYLMQGPKFYGGAPSTPTETTQTVNQNSIPSQLLPYAQTMFGAAENQVYQKDASGAVTGFQPYKPYSTNTADYVAPFSPLQQQAQQGAANLQTPNNFGVASNIAGQAGIGELGTTGSAAQFGTQGSQMGQNAANVGATGGLGYGAQSANLGMMAANQAGQGYNAGANFAQQATDPNAVNAYMSPYLQNVMNQQIGAANRQYDIAGTEQQGRATRAGAFGGSREALMASENERNRNTAIGGIQATGYQNAFTNAQAQQAKAAELGLQGMSAGNQTIQTGLQGIGQGITGVNTALQGYQQGISGAQAGLQGVGAQQAGYSGAGQAAGTLGQLGAQGLAAQTSILNTQGQFGGQQQAQQQQAIDQAVLDYKNAQQQPYTQLGMMSDLIRGTPISNATSTIYHAQPSMISQLGGLAATGIGAYGALKANGGAIEDRGYANGGIVGYKDRGYVEESMRGKLEDLDNPHLQAIIQKNESPEMTKLAKEVMATNYATGGIVAFANREDIVRDPYKDSGYDITNKDTDYGISDKLNQGLSYLTPSGILKGAKSIHNTLKTYGENTANPDMRLPGSKLVGINQIDPTNQVTPQQVALNNPAPLSLHPADTAKTTPQPSAANTPAEAAIAGPITDQPSLRNLATNQKEVDAAAKQNIRFTNNPTSQNPEDILSSLRENVEKARTESEKDIPTRIEEQRKIDEKYVGKDTGKEAYNESLKKEKEGASDDDRRMMYMRLMEFGANWGSTAGPPLVAGMQALKTSIPNVISDKKEAKTAMRNIDKAIYEVNHADYLERKGQVQKAAEGREKASDTFMKSRETYVTGALKQQEMNQKAEQEAAKLRSDEKRTGMVAGDSKALSNNQDRQLIATQIKEITDSLKDPTFIATPTNQDTIKNYKNTLPKLRAALQQLSPSLRGLDIGGSDNNFGYTTSDLDDAIAAKKRGN